MKKNEEKERAEEKPATQTAPREQAAEPRGLDLEELDLSVETIEERISPSETNVFDK